VTNHFLSPSITSDTGAFACFPLDNRQSVPYLPNPVVHPFCHGYVRAWSNIKRLLDVGRRSGAPPLVLQPVGDAVGVHVEVTLAEWTAPGLLLIACSASRRVAITSSKLGGGDMNMGSMVV
jgi:hypothetical protein